MGKTSNQEEELIGKLKLIELLKKEKKLEREVLGKEKEIVANWQTVWNADPMVIENGGSVVKINENICFKEWLLTEMDFLECKVAKNKKYNFGIKKAILAYLAILVVVFLIYTVLVLVDVFKMLDVKKYIMLLVVLLSLVYVATKWLDMKKYQESLARYTKLKTKILSEMVRYIYKVDKYDTKLRKVVFIENILQIIGGNINKFHDNMVNKEKDISPIKDAMEIFSPSKKE